MDTDADPPDWADVVLATWRRGQRRSAVGPGPVEAHLERSLALADQLSPPAVAVDLGSGAGIPGLALAGAWPASSWLLLDAAARRVALLDAAVRELGWGDRVVVRHGRAEEVAHERDWRAVADLVVARSFGPPAVTAECGTGFLRPGGLLVVTEPPPGVEPPRWPVEGCARLGLTPRPAPAGERVTVQRLERTGSIPDTVPRRPGVPAKRPLF